MPPDRPAGDVALVRGAALPHFSHLGPDALLVCLGLVLTAQELGTLPDVEASLRDLEARTGLRKDRVARAISRLSRIGAVVVIGRSSRRGRPTIYRLDLTEIGIDAGGREHQAELLTS